MRKQRGADHSVRRAEHSADRPGKSMNRAEPGISQRQPAEQTGQRHLLARFQIRTVFKGAAQRADGARQSFAAETVRHRAGLARNESFEQLRERIKPGCGGYGRRRGKRTFRIDDRQIGNHQRMADADFNAMLRRREYGVFRHFGTGSGGGRNRDARRGPHGQRLSFADDFEIVKRIAGIRQQRGRRFGQVDNAAAAEADHQIALRRTGAFNGFQRVSDRRLAADCKKFRADIFFFQRGEQRAGAFRIPSGDNQRAPAESCGGRRGLSQRSVAENNPAGGCKFKSHALLQPDSCAGRTVV